MKLIIRQLIRDAIFIFYLLISGWIVVKLDLPFIPCIIIVVIGGIALGYIYPRPKKVIK